MVCFIQWRLVFAVDFRFDAAIEQFVFNRGFRNFTKKHIILVLSFFSNYCYHIILFKMFLNYIIYI